MVERHHDCCPGMRFAVADMRDLLGSSAVVRAAVLGGRAAILEPSGSQTPTTTTAAAATALSSSPSADLGSVATAAAASKPSLSSSTQASDGEYDDADTDPADDTDEGRQFDVVIDKAAMDAVLAAKGDTWDPPESLLLEAHAICESVCSVLRPGGLFIQVSFSQPHFRKPYLMQNPAWWSDEGVCVEKVDAGFGYFAYIARRRSAA